MWILESNSDELNGVRRYLKPGKEYLVGRAKYITDITIDSRTVSKKHAKIVVGAVENGSSLLLEKKMPIYVIDLNSKFGTLVNNVKLTNLPKECDHDSEIIFAKCQGKFRLFWHPVVFTLSGIKIRDIQPLVESYGIKITKEYCDMTTHVVSKQRNTAKNLQALINGVFVVANSYVNELVKTIGLVELNFDHGFPNPQKHVPPDNIYSSIDACPEDFMPNKCRKRLFHGLVFVFFDKKQYFTLSPPINTAGGKTVLCEDTSNIEQIITFIQNYPNAIAVSPLENSHYIDMASKRLKINLINQDMFLEPILKLDLTLFWKNSCKDSDLIHINYNITSEKKTTSECCNQSLSNIKCNFELSPGLKSELDEECVYQVSKKHDTNTILNNEVDNMQNIKSFETINDIFDKNTLPLQKSLNSNRFITEGKSVDQAFDNKAFYFYERVRFDDRTKFTQTNQLVNNSNIINHIHEMEFQNKPFVFEKNPLNEKIFDKNIHETKLHNCVKSNSFIVSKDSEAFSTSNLQKNKTASSFMKCDPIRNHSFYNSEKDENLKVVEYFNAESNLQKSSINIPSRWNPKWNGRKNFKKFRRTQKIRPTTYIQHVRLVEYKPEEMTFVSESGKQKDKEYIFKKSIENTSSNIVKNGVDNKIKIFSKNIENYFDIIENDSDDDPLKFKL
ncbi:hypothetical protein PORY_000423 [Pneumocystis oryctolagi]|uniref:Uncharacterized protein n=1 Tax=Pneumocystis oryctolagi TaxID=42067 RepID=A0ACB7CG77_9ASCO|nr:hypothetical protein PORY_000423 [Pneumocystis oryctolagi]